MAFLSEEIRSQIRAYFPNYPDKRAVTLPALHLVHDALRCVPLPAIKEIAELLELHPAEVADTMSFYGIFRDENHKLGKDRVWVCRSISCGLRGGEELLENLCKHWKVKPGGTTPDGKVTLEFAECLGACEQAPCILVNDEMHGNMTEESVVNLMKQA
ncbi:NADH-quinone oxidoreductase subunit NuoE family protein [Planctomicrobium piriforme]|uniref:NADH-quinone oxidoreductase subunit E n=1 Tax=Planctomicrobium piriforme TaxID=1576369 RepID=A0A1I3QU28_9PLAN|nr:NAD(P)H-dependent oxidoreductase subunit E [Planctomicrobium piriforme]SFJ36616.1 NADH-quinone oxidoreductase subunit E [Planctomicrobium piriforme]